MSNGEQKSIQDDDILIEELFLKLNYNEKIILKIISCLALNISIEYMMIADCLADSIKEKNEIITALNSLVSNGWLEKDGEDICLNYLLAEEIKNNLKLDCDLSGKILLTKLMQYVSFIDRGNKNDAVQNINNVINEMDYSDTNQLDTLLSVASLYYERDMFEKAIEIYSVALNRFVLGKHEKSIIYRQLSEIYRLLKDYDKAIANLELAFEILEPNSIEKEYLRDRNFEEALEYCSRNHSVSAEFDLKGLIFKEFSRIYELNNSDIYG